MPAGGLDSCSLLFPGARMGSNTRLLRQDAAATPTRAKPADCSLALLALSPTATACRTEHTSHNAVTLGPQPPRRWTGTHRRQAAIHGGWTLGKNGAKGDLSSQNATRSADC